MCLAGIFSASVLPTRSSSSSRTSPPPSRCSEPSYLMSKFLEARWISVSATLPPSLFPFSLVILLQTAPFPEFSIPCFALRALGKLTSLAPLSAAHSEPANVNTQTRFQLLLFPSTLHLIISLFVANVVDNQNILSTLFTTDTNCNLKNERLNQHLSFTAASDCTVMPRKLMYL